LYEILSLINLSSHISFTGLTSVKNSTRILVCSRKIGCALLGPCLVRSYKQKLTQEHIFPNSAPKMRNKLTFETLNADMLHLKKTYRKFLCGEAGQEALT
jgi:hypothetical protein